MNRIRLAIILFGLPAGAAAAAAGGLPPANPYLADSVNPMPHQAPAQLDSVAVAGPLDRSRELTKDEIRYAHVGPGSFGAMISPVYPDGRRVLWSNGLNGVYKMDLERFEILAHLKTPDVQTLYTQEDADASIETLDESTDGLWAMYTGFKALYALRDLSGVYYMIDRDNRMYVGNKAGKIVAYGDTDPADVGSAIEKKGEYVFPAQVTGNLIGINMTYDGWIVTVTEHGHVVLVSRDLKNSHILRLRHAQEEGAADMPDRAGYGWVRNSYAVDADGGIYIASLNHMHKVVWTGEKLSIDAADGAWTAEFSNKGGGSAGATPSLMGFGPDEDKLVVFTDGDRVMNLTAMWRNAIPEGWQKLADAPSRRIAGMAPANMGNPDAEDVQSEQSVVVHGYGAAVVNNTPRNLPWYVPEQLAPLFNSYLGSNPEYQPFGVQKFEWDPAVNRWRLAWTNTEISSPNSMPILSRGANRFYTVGARNNQWTLEAIDWDSGASDFHYVIGGQRYNSLYAGISLDHEGRIYYESAWGRVRLEPRTSTANVSEASP